MRNLSSELAGRRLRAARALCNLKQDELAVTAGVARDTVSRIERGVIRPHRATVAAILRALEMRNADEAVLAELKQVFTADENAQTP